MGLMGAQLPVCPASIGIGLSLNYCAQTLFSGGRPMLSAAINAMRQAFTGIASVLADAGILTKELLENDISAAEEKMKRGTLNKLVIVTPIRPSMEIQVWPIDKLIFWVLRGICG